ncbi:LamG-like jellyroll fold domain-containing protein [Streptomyces fulvoviolaceus]|uniref:LamG-like jellyroll fold domain-containing protein n=1 Tax=Streptomyces fulvoviolaceus TaxID=285535 RepID=UPI0004C5885B|nr:LamG-like jellyroll fold domain-containing protein [Streptomyces fulvoviolaceus]
MQKNGSASPPRSWARLAVVGATVLAVAGAVGSPALAIAAVPAHSPTATRAPAGSSLGLTEDQALAKARSTGKSVQARAATTESSTLTANPNGTLTLRQTIAPVRKLADGRWKSLDATLFRHADGTISPKVSTGSLTLSGGGADDPLATMRAGSGSLAVSLPSAFALGTPTLSGPTATYHDVLPDVDLAVTAQDTGGFSEVLVVKNATAAANPALTALTLATKATGVTLTGDKAGDITAKDRAGRLLFSATAPTMWDSTRPAANTPKATDPHTGQTVDRHNGAPLASSPAAPGDAARKASLKATYRPGRIGLSPDRGLLTGEHTTYPVYIDPTFTASGQTDTVQAWAFVDNEWPDTAFWKPASSNPGPLHVGYTDWTSDVSTNRSFFQTSVHSALWNSTVLSSDISFYENWSASCTAKALDLYWTGSISSSTTWNNQPSRLSKIGSQSVAHGWSTSCGPADVTYSLTSLMQRAADNHWSKATFGLLAADEGDDLAWKQFSKQATITTTYDHTPTTPTSLTTSPATNCTATTPTSLGLGDVTLRAAVSDPDGTTSPLTANFTLKNMASGTTYTRAINATSGTTASTLYSHTASGPFNALTAKTEFAWYLTVTDQHLTSSQSKICHFYYDPTAPGAPTVAPVTSTTSECTELTDSPSGDSLCAVGTSASFTITDTNTTTAPGSYRYQLNGGNPVSVTASSTGPYTANISLKPTTQTDVLTVTAVGTSGNVGDTYDYRFIAQAPATATTDDLNGDGNADLLTVGGKNSLPAGLWQATGNGGGKVNAVARNIGIDGNGVSTTQTATSFTGTQAVTGHFFTGDGFNDVLDYGYDTSTGAISGEILRGQGDGTDLQPVDSLPVTNATGVFALTTTTFNDDGTTTDTTTPATSIATGGGLYYTVNGETPTGYPDLLLVINGSLYDENSVPATGLYPGADQATDLADYNPYCLAQNTATTTNCTTGWSGWTLTSTLDANGLPELFARDTSTDTGDPSHGQLWYLSPANLQTLTYDALSNGATDTTLTSVEAAASGWDSASQPTLQAADINNDGTPDLWTLGSTGTATAHEMTLSGTTATFTTPTGQALSTDTHDWPLNDYDTTALTADDSGTSAITLTGTSGVTAPEGGLFDPDVALDAGDHDYLQGAKALDLTKSFTVSVWADPTAYGGAVLSQSGSADSGILLLPTTDGWQFGLNTGAGTAWSFDTVTGGTVHLGTWAHLTATYDKTTGVMNLYVDDVFVATGNHTAPSTGASGNFQLGDALNASARTDYYSGELARVQTWTGSVVPPAQPYTPAGYHQAVTPTRILDTRTSSGLTYTSGITAGASTVTSDSVTQLKIAGDSVTSPVNGAPTTIPASVTAVAVDVTATAQTDHGYVTTYADGTQRPVTSSTNFTASTTRTGYQIVPVGNDGKIDLYTHIDTSSGTTALIVDLTGYFTSSPSLTGNQTYAPLTSEVRALDTRSSVAHTTLSSTGTVAAGTNFTLQITGLNGVPANATAVAVNLAAANAADTGFLQAYATGYAPTADTSLSYNPGNAIASLSGDVPIGTNGTITISVHSSAAAVIADISGYYTTSTTGQKFHTTNPTRLVDTRSGIGGSSSPVTSLGTYTLATSTTQQVTMATTPTLAAMLTVTNSTGSGYAIAYPTAVGKPATSNLNWGTDDTLANLTLTPTDANGQISIYNNSDGTADFIVDTSGYLS